MPRTARRRRRRAGHEGWTRADGPGPASRPPPRGRRRRGPRCRCHDQGLELAPGVADRLVQGRGAGRGVEAEELRREQAKGGQRSGRTAPPSRPRPTRRRGRPPRHSVRRPPPSARWPATAASRRRATRPPASGRFARLQSRAERTFSSSSAMRRSTPGRERQRARPASSSRALVASAWRRRHRRQLAGRGEQRQRVDAGRLEQPVAGHRRRVEDDQRLVDQLVERIGSRRSRPWPRPPPVAARIRARSRR